MFRARNIEEEKAEKIRTLQADTQVVIFLQFRHGQASSLDSYDRLTNFYVFTGCL